MSWAGCQNNLQAEKQKISAFGLQSRPPNLKAEYGRKSNFRFFSKWTVKLETVVDILVGQIEARLNENKSKPNDSGVNLNFEKSMANIIQSRSKTQNDSIDDDLKFTIKGDLQKYVLSVSASVFGQRPNVFQARYSVLAESENLTFGHSLIISSRFETDASKIDTNC